MQKQGSNKELKLSYDDVSRYAGKFSSELRCKQIELLFNTVLTCPCISKHSSQWKFVRQYAK